MKFERLLLKTVAGGVRFDGFAQGLSRSACDPRPGGAGVALPHAPCCCLGEKPRIVFNELKY